MPGNSYLPLLIFLFCNSYLQLLIFLFLIGLLLPSAIALRRREISSGRLRKWAIGGAILITLSFIVMACTYAISPSFSDQVEASIALGALRVLAGEQAFSDPSGAAQYALSYGPNVYLFNSLSVAIWPEVIAGSKLAGTIAVLVFCGFFALTCLRKNGPVVASLQLALVLGICLLFEQFSYWNRPEPLQLFGVALAITALSWKSPNWRAVALGSSVALLVNLKIHSLLYALPVVAELIFRRQWRVLFLGAAIAAAGLVAPFLFVDLFSFRNYLQSLAGAAKHSWSLELFAQNISALIFFALPLAAFAACNRWPNDSVSILDEPSPAYATTLGIVAFLACIIGSKLGAGPHHLIPLLPHLAWLMNKPFRSFLAATTIRPIALAATSAWIIAVLICATISQGQVWKGIEHDHGRVVIDDLHSIRATFPDYSMQVGCGNSLRWFLYWYRPELRSHAPVDFIDITAWMDMQFAGRTFSERTLETFRQEKFDIWLIPRFCPPFTQTSQYPPFGDLFSSEFREAFANGYRLAGWSRCFDIYLARRLDKLPTRR
jgi:hypothetical protein